MRPLLAFALALYLALAPGCSRRKDDDALGKSAVAAMRELNEADVPFVLKLNEAITKLSRALMRGTAGAAETIKTAILPLVDAHLAKLESAVAKGDAYLSTLPDQKPIESFEAVRRRAETFRKARARFVELEQKARAGATSEQIGQALMEIGLMLTVGN